MNMSERGDDAPLPAACPLQFVKNVNAIAVM